MGTCGQSYHERLEFNMIGTYFWSLGKTWMGTLVQWIFWPFCLGHIDLTANWCNRKTGELRLAML